MMIMAAITPAGADVGSCPKSIMKLPGTSPSSIGKRCLVYTVGWDLEQVEVARQRVWGVAWDWAGLEQGEMG